MGMERNKEGRRKTEMDGWSGWHVVGVYII
jgi:hypothetical protein